MSIVVSLVLSLLWTPRLVAATSGGEPAATHLVVPGETLWGLAREHAGATADPRAFVDRVRALNDLSTAELVPGQELKLPSPS